MAAIRGTRSQITQLWQPMELSIHSPPEQQKTKEAILNGYQALPVAFPWASAQREPANTHSSQFLPGTGLMAYFSSCCSRFRNLGALGQELEAEANIYFLLYPSYLLPVTFKCEGQLDFWSFFFCHFHWCPSLLFLELNLNIQLSQNKTFNTSKAKSLKYSDKYSILLSHTSPLCSPTYQKYSLLTQLFLLAFILAIFLNNIHLLTHLFYTLFTDFLLFQIRI